MTTAGALSGVKVIDLAQARAGPACVRQLADMGAEVIQVVGPRTSDMLGADAVNLHRNKRSMILDLSGVDGRSVFERLLADADVVVENFRPGVKDRLGVGPSTLLERHPRLVYGSISGFGQSGPFRDRPAVDQVVQGMGGLMSLTGPPEGGPWRAGIAVVDMAAGFLLTQGIVAALLARERTGRGQWVHTSLLEAMISLLDFQAARWLIDGHVPQRSGNQHPAVFPAGGAMFETADGHVNLAPVTGFAPFCEVLGVPGLAIDPRFADAEGRLANRAELAEVLNEATRRRTTAEWIDRIGDSFPCGPVLRVDEVFEHPQVRHLAMTWDVERAGQGSVPVLRHPVTFEGTPAAVRRGYEPPGTHTRELLAELGYSDAAVESMLDRHVVATESQGIGWLHR